MKNNEFDFLYYVYKNGLDGYRKIAQSTNISLGAISKLANKFKEIEALDEKGLTPKGIELLKPYKVDNAIIMAAGMSSRVVPLSLEMPKGLLKMRNDLIKKGIIDKNFVLQHDQTFGYVSSAAKFVACYSIAGTNDWKDSNGVAIGNKTI